MITLKELHELTGVAESDMRSAFMGLGSSLLEVGSLTIESSGDVKLHPSRVLSVLLLHWMTQSGYSREASMAALSHSSNFLKYIGNSLEDENPDFLSSDNPPQVSVFDYSRFVLYGEGSNNEPAIDLSSLTVLDDELLLPATVQSFFPTAAYIRSALTVRDCRVREEERESAQ